MSFVEELFEGKDTSTSQTEDDRAKREKRKRDYDRWQHGLFAGGEDRSRLNRMFGVKKVIDPKTKELMKQLAKVRAGRKAAPGRSQTILTKREKTPTVLG